MYVSLMVYYIYRHTHIYKICNKVTNLKKKKFNKRDEDIVYQGL